MKVDSNRDETLQPVRILGDGPLALEFLEALRSINQEALLYGTKRPLPSETDISFSWRHENELFLELPDRVLVATNHLQSLKNFQWKGFGVGLYPDPQYQHYFHTLATERGFFSALKLPVPKYLVLNAEALDRNIDVAVEIIRAFSGSEKLIIQPNQKIREGEYLKTRQLQNSKPDLSGGLGELGFFDGQDLFVEEPTNFSKVSKFLTYFDHEFGHIAFENYQDQNKDDLDCSHWLSNKAKSICQMISPYKIEGFFVLQVALTEEQNLEIIDFTPLQLSSLKEIPKDILQKFLRESLRHWLSKK